jgi:hypothetical protein
MFESKVHLIQLPRRTKDRTTGQYVTPMMTIWKLNGAW